MKKITAIIIILLCLILIATIFAILFPGTCGKYNFAAPYNENCNCIGIKTSPCAGISGSCDKGVSKCYGLRQECYRIWLINQSKEKIECE